MHKAIQRQGVRTFLTEEGPALLGALTIAELFYKWHSFLLECLGFLATWYVLSLIWSFVLDRLKAPG